MTFHILVQFDVPADMRIAFSRAGLRHAVSTKTEPGTLRFEIIQDQFNKSRFYFDEAYADETAFIEHCKCESLKTFIESIDSYAFGPVILFKGNRIKED